MKRLFLLVLLLAPLAAGEEETALRIEKVSLFKNGLGFVTSGAVLPEGVETVRLGQLPVPCFGTFWVGYGDGVRLNSLVTAMEEVKEKRALQNIGELLRANEGRRVSIVANENLVQGVILKGPASVEDPEIPNPYFMDTRTRRDPYDRYGRTFQQADMALIKTENGTAAVNVNNIKQIQFTGDEVNDFMTITHQRPFIRMELAAPAGGERVGVSYLARGVTWSPSYLIDLSDPETARLSARALIVNELSDFHGIRLELVTGYPHIRFKDVSSPVAMTQSLAEFLRSLSGGGGPASSGGGYLGQQAVLSNTALYYDESAEMPDYPAAAEGEVAEDLFLYPLEAFSLKKNETAWVPLFTAEMPYQHLYTWKIDDLLDTDDRYRNETEDAEEVWHSCRFKNPLKMPLTTAAAQFVTDGSFTGQDVCHYTAPGTETTVRMNRAMNLLAEEEEIEAGRDRNAASFYGRSYDRVLVKGVLKVRSRLDETVEMEITKAFSGELLESSPEGKDVKTAKGLKQVNPKHLLTWRIEIAPGEALELSYRYQVYIRN